MSSKLCPFCMQMAQAETCPHCGKNVNYTGKPAHLPAGYVVSGKHPYVLGAALGQGGFGITYIALDMVTNVRVAIKEYYPAYCSVRENASSVTPYSNQEDVYFKGKERFLDEARTLKSLSDLKCIVNVLDFFEANNTAYLVMEFLDGKSLKEFASKNGKFPAQQFINQIKPLMEDIHRMHERGVIHRDIAPDNIILLPDGQMKLIDFGAARSYVGDKSMTVVVKKGFAPVEQYMSKGSTAATDVYALAATIYYCITGRVPPDSAARQYDNVPLEMPSAHGADLTPQQEKTLLKALEIQQKDRTQSVQAFLDNLRVRKPVQQKTVPLRTVQQKPVQQKPVQPKPVQHQSIKQKPEKRDFKRQDKKKGWEPTRKMWNAVTVAAVFLSVLLLVMTVLLNNRENDSQLANAPSTIPTPQAEDTEPLTDASSTIPISQPEPWEQNVLIADPLSSLPNIPRDKIISLTFLDTCGDAPSDAWDVSVTKNGTVLAWAKKYRNQYSVWFAAEGGINAANACSNLFLDCTSLESVQFGNAFHTDYVTDMSSMFYNCKQLNDLDVSAWDTSRVTNMSDMFFFCDNLTTLDVNGWDTSRVTDMKRMFFSCENITTLDVSRWNTSCVTNMKGMFQSCYDLNLLDVSSWDTSKVTDMSYLFSGCKNLTALDVSSWDTSNVTDISCIFPHCFNLTTLDVSNWDTSNVADMSYMFSYCSNLSSLDVTKWDISNVKSYREFMSPGKLINGKPWEEFFISQKSTIPNNDASISSSADDIELKLAKSDIIMGRGVIYQLELLNGLSADDVEWSSEHPYIASVTDEGVVTTYQSGTTAIIVRYGDQTVQCIIRVR